MITRGVYLDELNPQQREAVTHGEGPLMIIAGAGSGKTRTLACRVAHLIGQGVPPDRILLLTFTRRAAQEMLNRATSAIARDDSTTAKVFGGTFHSFANRMLRIYSQAAGLAPEFTIIDRPDAEDLLDVIRNDLALSQKDTRFPRKGTCLSIYSRRVNGGGELADILKKDFPWCAMWGDELKALFQEYVQRKQKLGVLDYDDLLLYLYYLLEDEKAAESIGGRFDHVLIDEYQDTNKLQADILFKMRAQNRNIAVVGDDAQSIYSFRSATVRNILEFPQQYPGTRTVTLTQNYRSTTPILSTSNLVIAQARERYSKELWSERKGDQKPQLITCVDESHQDSEVIRLVLEHYEQGIPLHKQAVLFRAASHSNSLELALHRHNIPFHKYGGLKFLEAAHVKDLVGFLRIMENPRDGIAWFRVLQLLSGVGPATASDIFQHITSRGSRPSMLSTFNAPPAAAEQLTALTELIRDLEAMGPENPSLQVERISRFYVPLLEENYEDPEPRANDIEHLAQIAQRYKTRGEFLSELVLDPPVSTGDLAGPPYRDEDWLVLSTIHSAKGLEWDTVYMIHAADGCLPSDMSTGEGDDIEEELRLAYVAMTRARDFLYVLWPLRYYHKWSKVTDNHSYAQLSRFITEQVAATMDCLTPKAAAAKPEPASTETYGNILAKLNQMWK